MTQELPNAEDSMAGGDVAMLVRSVQQDLLCEGPPWRVCVRCDHGPLSAAFTLQGFEQVLLFERRLEALGYEMLMLDKHFMRCDFALTATARASNTVD